MYKIYQLPEIIQAFRAANPARRAVDVLYLYRNGANGPRQQACCLCGQRGPTWCGKWRKTVAARDWADGHEAQCWAVVEAEAALSVAAWVQAVAR